MNNLNKIPHNQILEVLTNLIENNIRILGIDGFIVSQHKTIAPIEACADYSEKQPTLNDIKNYLNNIPSEITHFEITT